MSNYELWLSRDDGTRIAQMTNTEGFEYAIVMHDVGVCRITLPGIKSWLPLAMDMRGLQTAMLATDMRLEIWRQPTGGALALERVYLLRRAISQVDASGRSSVVLSGVDGNDLLRRRIVAYAAGSAEARMSGEVDDLCKTIVRQNLGVDAAVARQIDSAYFTVETDMSAGPSLTRSFSWRTVLTVLQDLAQAAQAAGTAIYWHVADIEPTRWQFCTRIGQPGQDHTYPNGQSPVLFGLEYGNLAEPSLDEDYTDEVTYVYAGGQGEGSDRNIQTAEEVPRSTRSLYGRREAFSDARNEESDAGVLAAARGRLSGGRPRRRFTARLVDAPSTRYGTHWRWGDKLTAIYEDQSYDAIVRAIRVRVDGSGHETIDARLDMEV